MSVRSRSCSSKTSELIASRSADVATARSALAKTQEQQRATPSELVIGYSRSEQPLVPVGGEAQEIFDCLRGNPIRPREIGGLVDHSGSNVYGFQRHGFRPVSLLHGEIGSGAGDHGKQREQGEQRRAQPHPGALSRGLAITKLPEINLEKAGDDLEKPDLLAIALLAKVGGERVDASERRREGVFRGALDDDRHDCAGPTRREHSLYFHVHPSRSRRCRTATDNQPVGLVQFLLKFGTQLTRRRKLVPVAEDAAESTLSVLSQRFGNLVGFKPPVQSHDGCFVPAAVAEKRAKLLPGVLGHARDSECGTTSTQDGALEFVDHA